MTRRYFVESPITSGPVTLSGAEAHHLLHVMRGGEGDQVVLFDGSGAEFPARIESVGRTEVRLAVLARDQVDRELSFELTLAVALPKGDRQRWLVEKTVELGVTRLVPLCTERSIAQAKATSLDRLRRVVVEASKQCGRNRLMEIASPQNWGEFVRTSGARRFVADPDASESSLQVTSAEEVLLAVGPEGGFAPAEIAAARREDWIPLGLGPRTLRVETAALVLCARVAAQMTSG